MAKISARGATKVAQANKTWTDSDGYDHKVILSLRSDGAVLRKHSLRSPMMRENCGARGWNEGSYSIVAKGVSPERFKAYAADHGYTIK